MSRWKSAMWLPIAALVMSFQREVWSTEDTAPPGSGAEYLLSVMSKLHNERTRPEIAFMDRATDTDPFKQYKIMGPTPVPSYQVMEETLDTQPTSIQNIHTDVPPPPPLSKEELASLYQAAINKGSSLGPALFGNEVTSGGLGKLQQMLTAQHLTNPEGAQSASGGTIPGYYYYFYPIKSFSDGNIVKNNLVESPEISAAPSPPKARPMMLMDGTGQKSVEPLFMAVTGFIGMALMFIISALFLPRFGTLKSRGISALKQAPDELATLTKLVIEAIDGKDCSERVACEVGRVVRKMKGINKPLRILEILLPPAMGKQLLRIRKSAAKKEKCNFIPCKWKKTYERNY